MQPHTSSSESDTLQPKSHGVFEESVYQRARAANMMTLLALFFAETVVLPSLSSYLAAFHAESTMLGFCIAATYVGSICTAPLFSWLYTVTSARDLCLLAIVLAATGSLFYALAHSVIAILSARFLVGCAAGVQGSLVAMSSGICRREDRYNTVVAMKSLYSAAFILGSGLAAVATFVHTPAPGPFNHIEHALPRYVHMLHMPNVSDVVNSRLSFGSLGGLVIPPDQPGASKTAAKAALMKVVRREEGGAGAARHARKLLDSEEPARRALPSVNSGKGRSRDRRGTSNVVNASKTGAGAFRYFSKDVHKMTSELNKVGKLTQKDLGMGGFTKEEEIEEAGGQKGLKTDQDIANEIGDHRMYMPQYVTAIVGHGLQAPGFLGVLICSLAFAFVYHEWSYIPSEFPREKLQLPLPNLPLSSFNPRSNPRFLLHLTPIIACVAMELLFQTWLASVETIVAPITGIYLGFTIDATAVFMMGIFSAGVVGMAVLQPMKSHFSTRSLMILCILFAILGMLLCVPWFGQLSPWQYALGCYTCAFALFPASSMASEVFARSVYAAGAEGRDVSWMQAYWAVTTIPSHVIVPIVLSYLLQFDRSASLCYLGLLIFSALTATVFMHYRRTMTTAHLGEEDDADEGTSVIPAAPQQSSYGSFPRPAQPT
ncbi:hypothetical protein GUITHDRAFT_115887 [Guillardia theta CCMP2712]|uniref:Major facilitator superfamily (MFS) profile domain-containing protein n=2 Tax=Guillardia theta TaxID=55529 RepID=L1IPC3_GUITC|nr:hypothetical protein GUITHDRAFT_115887 [Guillardia theta CCMP2712]EKX37912.1 hypothetical protein GUITHDRAFT_115887 [Guillardia theta CCMP2712]|mmetsp:Transcript_32646/g.103359  ORF Transcript_32646/g.103359 Transcript_32646/m.103359 type:complete len:658 (+) Transcript_32646:133-2106(+)|eukprot:XP_005824892.1 hypothetical protein GUITHDRAFT_115887 [Guillardia theta CCMP2712]